MGELNAKWPKFWAFDTSRAYSLLPRWHGEEGNWEAFAEKAAARPDGVGVEVYARIVASLASFYDNIFKETKASWPKTKEGLEQILKKHPDSAELRSLAALLATKADDRPFAKANFDELGTTFLRRIWRSPEAFAEAYNWSRSTEAL
jgi:hypothetical protein